MRRDSENHDLLVFDAFGFGKPIDVDILELERQDLAAVADVVRGNDHHQNASALQPTIHVIEKQPLHALRFPLADFEIVGRIQVNQRKGLDRALHIKAIPVNYFVGQ